jgi:hypothetical protein
MEAIIYNHIKKLLIQDFPSHIQNSNFILHVAHIPTMLSPKEKMPNEAYK